MIELSTNKGFTLIEMLIATSIFLIVATVSVASLLASTKSLRKIQSDRGVHQAARIAFEQMSRDIRQSKGVACIQVSPVTDCVTSGSDPRISTDQIAICGQEGTTFVRKFYRFVDTSGDSLPDAIEFEKEGEDAQIVTPPGITVSSTTLFASNKMFRLVPSHATGANPCDTPPAAPAIYVQPFVELAADFRNFPDLATPPPPEKQSKISLRTMVSLRNFTKQYQP